MKLLPYAIEIGKKLRKRIKKAGSKNPDFKNALNNKIAQILENPQRFKPLGWPLQNKHRVHILKSFVLVYEVIENEKIVRILDIDHHDNVYKT